MIDLRYKPMWLPQINAPFTYTLDMLEKEGVDYKYMQIDPDELIPSQGIVAQDKISEIDVGNIQPIWISKDKKILDGHHRYVAALTRNLPIKTIQIMLNQKDAIRVLNKIQDIFDYETQEGIIDIDEVVAQDQIIANNETNTKDIDDVNFFENILKNNKKDDIELLLDSKPKKPKKITAYRKSKLKKKSKAGNFFSIKQIDGYTKYSIEFDNLLDTNDLLLTFRSGINPVEVLAKNWFPNIDFEKLGKKYNVPSISIINRAIAEKAKEMGYDGIKYGDIMIQGLN